MIFLVLIRFKILVNSYLKKITCPKFTYFLIFLRAFAERLSLILSPVNELCF